MSDNKKKKKKVVYYDDGRTIADMSGLYGKPKTDDDKGKNKKTQYTGGEPDIAVTCCIGVTDTPWPKAEVASSILPT